MIVNNEIYISQQSHFDSLENQDREVFLDYLFDSFMSSKANIFWRFIQANPFMEDYILDHKLAEYDLVYIGSDHHILHNVMQIEQHFLPNIIFMRHGSYHVILREPFNTNRLDIESKLRSIGYRGEIFYCICRQVFLSKLDLCINLQKYFNDVHLHEDLLRDLIFLAYSFNASDIHLGLQNNSAYFMMRLHGVLVSFMQFDKELFTKLSQKLKLLCQIDINKIRMPQDGHFHTKHIDKESKLLDSDIRLSFLPTHDGESIALRIPHSREEYFHIDSMNMQEGILRMLKHSLLYKNGLILISGPTGSAKSTLLYNAIKYLHNGQRKIITIEDPIERNINGITQCQVNEELGLSFDVALKYILRQDPDVIMVGEIRDERTLDISIRAALTGHLVLSSIHAQGCESSIARLLDLGAKDYLLDSVLRCVISQRLLKTLCPYCKHEIDGSFHAKGCEYCYHRGYGERILIQEILDFSTKDTRGALLDFAKDNTQYLLGSQTQRLYKEGIISYEESLL